MGRDRRVADLLPWAGLVADGVVITKDALLLRSFRIVPKDLSLALAGEVEAVYRQIALSLRYAASDGWWVYIDQDRHSDRFWSLWGASEKTSGEGGADGFAQFERDRRESIESAGFWVTDYTITLAYALGRRDRSAWFFEAGKRPAKSTATLDRDLYRFLDTTEAVADLLSAAFASVAPLSSSDMLTYLHALVGPRHQVEPPEGGFYLDVYLSDSAIDDHKALRVGDEYVQTLTVRDWPGTTHFAMLSALGSVTREHRVVSRFGFWDREKAKKKIASASEKHYARAKSAKSYMSAILFKGDQGDTPENSEAVAKGGDAQAALTEFAYDSEITFGELATAIVIRDSSRAAVIDTANVLRKLAQSQGMVTKRESYANLSVWLGTLPGNVHLNHQRQVMSSRNLGHLFPSSAPWQGSRVNEHLAETFGYRDTHVIARSGTAPFYLNLDSNGVGHTAVIGPTGSGKSTLLAVLALQWLRYPKARVVVFDKKASSRPACLNAGGQFFDLGSESGDLKVNPVYHVGDAHYRAWFAPFMCDYFRSAGITVDAEGEAAVAQKLATLGTSSRPEHLGWAYFRNNIQGRDQRAALEPLIEGGHSADLFREGPDGLDALMRSRFVTFELDQLLRRDRKIAALVLGYLFDRVERALDGSPTLVVLDEAWMALEHETMQMRLRTWLKELRKLNAYVILATQELQDLYASPAMVSTVTNNCPTKIYLANDAARTSVNREMYARFGLSETEIDTLAEATPRQDYLMRKAAGHGVFQLGLDTRQLEWITEVRDEAGYEVRSA